ncbi:hypothetical protein N782_21165 [Pontibacillus yanchengensis Y32]|uniref:Uncharacterized protein n=1 Tax=Pontibacillus yanchengensis Y32 TaxID=1385514 RepID=A0A0A2TEG2_9BACI|nr:hypothetical protein N782_21165 [Pontibacillus yanchengensis Y32]
MVYTLEDELLIAVGLIATYWQGWAGNDETPAGERGRQDPLRVFSPKVACQLARRTRVVSHPTLIILKYRTYPNISRPQVFKTMGQL